LPKIITRGHGKIGLQGQHFSQHLVCRLAFAKLSVYGRDEGLGEEVPLLIALEQEGPGAAVVTLAIRIKEVNRPIPRWMIGVHLSRTLRQLTAVLPVARKRNQVAQIFDRGSVHRVEDDSPFSCVPEGVEFLAEEQSLAHCEPGEMIAV